MPTRVSDDLVCAAAEALLAAAETVTTEQGLKVKNQMTLQQAKCHVMGAIAVSLGHYSFGLMPTGWTEINGFGEANDPL